MGEQRTPEPALHPPRRVTKHRTFSTWLFLALGNISVLQCWCRETLWVRIVRAEGTGFPEKTDNGFCSGVRAAAAPAPEPSRRAHGSGTASRSRPSVTAPAIRAAPRSRRRPHQPLQPVCLRGRKDAGNEPAAAFQGAPRLPQKGGDPGFRCAPWHRGLIPP